MNNRISKVLKEFIWFIAIIGISALIEFVIIESLNLHPVLSIKLQGLIGLIIIGYIIRMLGRLWSSLRPTSENEENTESFD